VRLALLAEPAGWRLRLLQKVLGVIPGRAVVMSYRAGFFGRHYTAVLHQALRGEAWSRGELALMAAFVSSRNQSAYGIATHGALAAAYLGDDKVRWVLDDYLTAPIGERLRATMVFLEKVTLLPADVGGDDVQRLHLAGVTDQAIREALLVCFLAGILDRLAEPFGFELPPPRARKPLAFLARLTGYRAF
jgi:alkylhydroperoxidase family enzyme